VDTFTIIYFRPGMTLTFDLKNLTRYQ